MTIVISDQNNTVVKCKLIYYICLTNLCYSDMKDRILQFLSAEKISPAEFADKIGVQRSSMSHILNGRNYPSASFIQKMLMAYPLINSRWLMIGEGKMNIGQEKEVSRSPSVTEIQILPETVALSERENIVLHDTERLNLTDPLSADHEIEVVSSDLQNSSVTGSFTAPGRKNELDANAPETSGMKSKNDLNQSAKPVSPVILNHEEKEIEQILFFYRDKTFSLYRPS